MCVSSVGYMWEAQPRLLVKNYSAGRYGWSNRAKRGQPFPEATVQRKIVGFHQDEVQDWVADLECGHTQHVRHQPPWLNRPWVVSPEGRRSRIGYYLDCKSCDQGVQISAVPES